MTILIDPWGSTLIRDYEKLIDEFGLETFHPELFPEPNRIMRRNIVFAGRDFKQIADAIKNKKRYYVLSGIMPSDEKIHFGNRLVIENIRYFQEHNASAFVVVADLESAATRGVSLEEARKRALDLHIPAYIALGLNPKDTTFYFQSDNKTVMRLGYEFSKKITSNEFRAIYGSTEPGKIISAVTQVGDILFPQLKERMPGIIPVGVDQDNHIRLTRDIVKRTKQKYNFFYPSSMYHKYTPSLDGSFKMSKSKPSYCISIPEDPEVAARKIRDAFTGGRDTEKEQRKKGGQPVKCMIFEMFKQHLIDDDKKLNKIYEDCKVGKIICKDCKAMAADLMKKFMIDFNKKIKIARKKVSKLKFVNDQ